MFWDESQFPLAVFILKGVKCLCTFHQVTCWCFSSSRCLSWTEGCFPAGGNNQKPTSALGGSARTGRSWRCQLRRRLNGGSGAPVVVCLPLTHWSCSTHWFSSCFQRCPWYQSLSSFSSLFPCLYHWVQLGAKGQHKIRGAWPSTGLLWILVSGGGSVGWETVSYLEFPVWVLGRLLGIPMLITNFLFQLRSLPDNLEPNTRLCHKLLPATLLLWSSLQ